MDSGGRRDISSTTGNDKIVWALTGVLLLNRVRHRHISEQARPAQRCARVPCEANGFHETFLFSHKIVLF
jgi:hypothetical protein